MRTGRHFAYNLLGTGLPLLLAIAAVPLVGRQAGYERLGFLTIVWAAIGYLGFLDFGLSRVFARRVAVAAAAGQLPAETAFLRWIARRLFAVCALLALLAALAMPTARLAGAAASPEWLAEVRLAWILLATTIPALVLSNLWRGAMEGCEAFGAVNALRVLMGVWTFGAPLLVLPFSHSLPALVGGVVVGRWLSLALHQGWCWRRLPGTGHDTAAATAEWRGALRHTLAEGAWFTVSGVVGPIMVIFDRFLLGALAALGTVPVYAIPQEIVLRLILIPALLAGVLFPRMAVLAQTDTPAAAALIDRATRVTIVLQLPLCLAAAWLATPALGLWLGADIAVQGAPILRWLLVGCIFNTAAQVPFAHLQASGRSHATARIHLAEVLPYAAALYWAVAGYGALGAAWVWSARCAVDAGLMFYVSRRIDPLAISPRLLLLLAGAALVCLCAALPGATGVPGNFALGAVLLVLLSALGAAVGLERTEGIDLLRRFVPGR